MTPPAMPRARRKAQAFVSYARSDGEAFARELAQRLQTEGIALWRDREDMVGGRDFWQQITCCAAPSTGSVGHCMSICSVCALRVV